MRGIRIGQVLIEQGVLTEEQVEHVLKVQKKVSRPFGDLAERLYGIDPNAIETAWTAQYVRMVGVTDLSGVSLDAECLNLLNRRQAWQFHCLPIGRENGELSIATTADNLVRAVNFATRKLHEPIYFVIADPEQLHDHLMRHYPVPEHIAEYAAKL
jgi:hypothetical protein